MMRYIRSLERKDIGLDTSMIPLGSCTMKLNAATEMLPVTWPEFSKLHPFAPVDQAEGYQQIFRELEAALCEITGFAAVSLQPNSGAQGEFAGLMVIRAYHRTAGDTASRRRADSGVGARHQPGQRRHGGHARRGRREHDRTATSTSPTSSAKAGEHARRLAALMVTYPSTHGVFEESIQDICAIVHAHGGQVYMDGANMNAQVGLTSPAAIGADVCHLNLHKTFAIPHGGGGPGMGPIGVAAHLAPYLPGHPVVKTGGAQAIPALSAAPWGSASILLISYAYIDDARRRRHDGRHAVRDSQRQLHQVAPRAALPGAVHAAERPRRARDDLRPPAAQAGQRAIDETDVAKRLMDYGFHAPTVSFPWPGR